MSWLKATSSWFRHGYDLLGRSLNVLLLVRGVLALHAVVQNLVLVMPQAANPLAVALVTAVVVGWTAFVSWRFRKPSGRTVGMFLADLAVTLAVVASTAFVVGEDSTTMPLAALWMVGSSLYVAVLSSRRWAFASALAVSAVYLLAFREITLGHVNMVLITLISTYTLGELMSQFKASITEQERERIRTVALAERERLSRIVHDGALQVLALVEREGPSLGPRGIRLAALARESESQLRNLLRDREIVDDEQAEEALVDLAAALDKYQSARVTVSTMAGQVMVPRLVVDEVEATLLEALKNVEKHAGKDAEAWVLLDQETDDEVILWVRDNGVGMSADQVTDASIRGRMGIKDSIVGRMSALGGSAMLKSSPGLGTEWELRFPVDMGEL
ncbi:hypothetical protein FOJ82_07025 [Tessaracoccus rhinocerotis]|uniref:Histidine kinase/HSP90-like ATPase domain-containing protein n=1 Tax=Tessaracoccus rhinocerotis TaxID=1689449 RepID=A0A553K2D2_9ACTN|nr:ATP-binding protein [Tessaracoccus rhinocerotis]TRY18855.1 hypothetical protein FOJ82_07025 [Tessaracoccus rhinocerotis]